MDRGRMRTGQIITGQDPSDRGVTGVRGAGKDDVSKSGGRVRRESRGEGAPVRERPDRNPNGSRGQDEGWEAVDPETTEEDRDSGRPGPGTRVQRGREGLW